MTQTGYEQNIAEQPQALADFAGTALPSALGQVRLEHFGRIVLTGMGSSDHGALPTELALARRGLPVWRLATGRLLESPQLVTPDTLLWITSQSGRSAEVVALLNRLPRRPACVFGVTNDLGSPLAQRSDIVLPLACGAEATVSTKSYLNTLAAHHRAVAVLTGGEDAAAVAEIRQAAESLRAALARLAEPTKLAQRALARPRPRIALVGTGPDAASALTGGLIVKESTKLPAEGFLGGDFRHGPMEIAGPELTVLLFGSGTAEDTTLARLAADLVATGSSVVTVAPVAYPGTVHFDMPDEGAFSRTVHGIVRVQLFTLALARAAGVVPGAFRFGSKVTDVL